MRLISCWQHLSILIKENESLNLNSITVCIQCFKSLSKSCILGESVCLNLTSNVHEKHLSLVFELVLFELRTIWLLISCFRSLILKALYQCLKSLSQRSRIKKHLCWCKHITSAALHIAESDLKKSTNMMKS